MASFNFNDLFARKPKKDGSDNKSSDFNELLNGPGQDDPNKPQKTSGFNEFINGPEGQEPLDEEAYRNAGQPAPLPDDSANYDTGRNAGLNRAGGNRAG